MDLLQSFAAGFAATLVGCIAFSRAVPVPLEPFRRHMAARTKRLLGRGAVVLAVIAAGLGWLGLEPRALTAGALLGWLAPAAWEAWDLARRGRLERAAASGMGERQG